MTETTNEEVKLVDVPLELVEDVSNTTAQAYMESPAYKWVFPEDSARLIQMTVLFRAYYHIVLGRPDKHATRCFVIEEKDQHGQPVKTVVCSFLLLNAKYPPTLWEMIRNGLLRLPFIYGMKTTLTLLKLGSDLDRDIEEVAKGRECMKLERMIVNPRFQGQGYGSKCLRLALEEERFKGKPVVLCTQEERNVRFYKKLGFEVAKEEDYIADGNAAFHAWTLVKEP